MYTVLILEKSGQTDRGLSESIYGRPLRDLINLNYNVSRLWRLDEDADFRALWTGFLQTFVTYDFIHLWQAMKKSPVHKGVLSKAIEESRYLPPSSVSSARSTIALCHRQPRVSSCGREPESGHGRA